MNGGKCYTEWAVNVYSCGLMCWNVESVKKNRRQTKVKINRINNEEQNMK